MKGNVILIFIFLLKLLVSVLLNFERSVCFNTSKNNEKTSNEERAVCLYCFEVPSLKITLTNQVRQRTNETIVINIQTPH